MDVATVIGIALGAGLIIGAILLGGDVALFIDTESLVMILGGSFAGVLINYPISQVISAFQTLRVVFAPRRRGKNAELVEFLVYLVERSRREGLLALEDELETLTDPFLRRGLELVIDGTPPELVRDVLEKEIDSLIVRHRHGRGVFETLGALCPAFGMIGTLVGLIRMLRDLDDPSNIGGGMALALMTTLYGAVAAYLVFIPIAGKLKIRTTEEVRLKEMVIEGLLAILAGESPRYTREKLTSFLSPDDREELAWAVRASIGEGEGVEVYAE